MNLLEAYWKRFKLLPLRSINLQSRILGYIAPGKPVRKGFAESLFGRFWDVCLNEQFFTNYRHARGGVTASNQSSRKVRHP